MTTPAEPIPLTVITDTETERIAVRIVCRGQRYGKSFRPVSPECGTVCEAPTIQAARAAGWRFGPDPLATAMCPVCATPSRGAATYPQQMGPGYLYYAPIEGQAEGWPRDANGNYVWVLLGEVTPRDAPGVDGDGSRGGAGPADTPT